MADSEGSKTSVEGVTVQVYRQRRWGPGINIRPEAVTGTQASALIVTLQRMRLNLAILQPTKRVR